MILEILEYDYKGFHLVHDESGWKCVIGEQEIKFKYSTAAESAIDEILKDADNAIKKYDGTVICNVDRSRVTKTLEREMLY